jgi:hypothetical protein
MDGVLQLSAESSGLTASASELRGVGALYLSTMSHPPGHDSVLFALQLVANFVLLKAKQFTQAVPDTWTSSFHGGGVPPGLSRNDFADVAHRQIWLGSFALMSRLGMLYISMFVFYIFLPPCSFIFRFL